MNGPAMRLHRSIIIIQGKKVHIMGFLSKLHSEYSSFATQVCLHQQHSGMTCKARNMISSVTS